ncbi:hypothetical protein B566_EDAN003531, partial [Ephemera danica]
MNLSVRWLLVFLSKDELTALNVKHGFSLVLQLNDEFGTARNCNVNASKVGAYFNGILTRKEELNTLPDSGRRRPQINTKDSFWPATPRTKHQIESWFRDLAGNKPLSSLSKRAPNFNKKEEIFMLLCEYQVPLLRATWFIKLSSAHTVAITEAKMKKRQLPDPAQEWTQTLTKFMRDQQAKLQDHYNNSSGNTAGAGTSPSLSTEEHKTSLKQWNYCMQLARHMYEFLTWVMECVDRAGSPDSGMLHLMLPLALQYLNDMVQSELLARRLAFLAARRLSHLCSESPSSSGSPNSPVQPNNGATNNSSAAQTQPSPSQLVASFNEYLACPHHRDTVALECPTALVWNNLGEHKSPSVLNGSPLDQLPCAPSSLPMPPRADNQLIRNQLRVAEGFIRNRSRASEGRWSCDKWQQSKAGPATSTLEARERQENPVSVDAPVVQLLCEWAVSTRRWGEHRAMAVAKLLERRQADLAQACDPVDVPDDKDSAASSSGGGGPPPGLPVFQSLLMSFLDTEAPVLEDNPSASNRAMFGNLVHLFYELVRNDVFSHDAYMCTLISRGDLLSGPTPAGAAATQQPPPNQNKSQTGLDLDPRDDDSSLFAGIDLKPTQVRGGMGDYDDSKIDDDLDKLLQHIKEEQQNSLDAPDSPKDDAPAPSLSTVAGISGLEEGGDVRDGRRQSRHLVYTTHFPLPQDDSSSHDSNQRHVLLYGVGRIRDEARHVVKRTSKEIARLFSKKFSIDVAEGGRVKKHSRGEFNFEAVTQKMQGLSYFDQHVVTFQCAATVIEMLISFASGSSNYLPVQEHVAFLFDLMELALNIHGLIDVCI